MTTNAERQAAYKERMRNAGYQQVTLWVSKKHKQALLDAHSVLMEYNPKKDVSFKIHSISGDMWFLTKDA